MELQWEYHYKDLKGSPQVKFDSNSIEIVLKDQGRVRVVPFDSLGEARVRCFFFFSRSHSLCSRSVHCRSDRVDNACARTVIVNVSIQSTHANPAFYRLILARSDSYFFNKIILRALARL